MREENDQVRALKRNWLFQKQICRGQIDGYMVSVYNFNKLINDIFYRAEAANVHLTVADKVIESFEAAGSEV